MEPSQMSTCAFYRPFWVCWLFVSVRDPNGAGGFSAWLCSGSPAPLEISYLCGGGCTTTYLRHGTFEILGGSANMPCSAFRCWLFWHWATFKMHLESGDVRSGSNWLRAP